MRNTQSVWGLDGSRCTTLVANSKSIQYGRIQVGNKRSEVD
jgi:hypothetical protein